MQGWTITTRQGVIGKRRKEEEKELEEKYANV